MGTKNIFYVKMCFVQLYNHNACIIYSHYIFFMEFVKMLSSHKDIRVEFKISNQSLVFSISNGILASVPKEFGSQTS